MAKKGSSDLERRFDRRKWNGSEWVGSEPSGAAGPQSEKADTGLTGATELTGATGAISTGLGRPSYP